MRSPSTSRKNCPDSSKRWATFLQREGFSRRHYLLWLVVQRAVPIFGLSWLDWILIGVNFNAPLGNWNFQKRMLNLVKPRGSLATSFAPSQELIVFSVIMN